MAILTLDNYRNAEKQIINVYNATTTSITTGFSTAIFFGTDNLGIGNITVGAYPTSDTNCMPKINPFPTDSKGYITKAEVSVAYNNVTSYGASITLYDLLWWSGTWGTTGDLVTTPDITSRLPVINSSPDYSNVELLLIQNGAQLTGGTGTEQIRYINQDNTANRIATYNIDTSISLGSVVYPQLQTGDKQVKSVNGFTLVTALDLSGFNIALARRLMQVSFPFCERDKLIGIESSGICEIFENSAIFGVCRGRVYYPTINLEISML